MFCHCFIKCFNHKQFVSINGYDSGLAEIKCGVPQGSVLGPLPFLLYINDLNQAIKFCKVHHFADDTNLLYLGKSIKKLNKLVNYDLKNLLYWLNANKISLNVKKTELVVFKSKRKQFDDEIKLKLSHKRLFPTDSVKYLGVKIDGNLSWKSHIDYLSVKLSRANALLFKIRNFVNSSVFRTMYFAIFESHLNYCCLVWSQNCNAINRLVILQKTALRIINFQPRNTHSSPLFKSFILKFSDKVTLENTLFVSKSINNLLPSLFNDWFFFSSDQHNYETSCSFLGNLHKPSYKINLYGKNSIIVSAINAWNNSQKLLKIYLRHLSPNRKKNLSDALFSDILN